VLLKGKDMKKQQEDILKMQGLIFNIQKFSIHDGPGIRTVVFMKGCSLRCLWCSNPESQNRQQEIFYYRSRCTLCQQCIKTCQKKAITLNPSGGIIVIDRKRCNNCGDCTKACLAGALVLMGKWMSIRVILKEVEKDRVFYKTSGGGITLSGGDPLMQADFAYYLLKESKKIGINTAIETDGYLDDKKKLMKALFQCDYILWDFKMLDGEKHKKYTGSSNKIILDNLKEVLANRMNIILRFPVIPGINDDIGYFKRVFKFINEIDKEKIIKEIHLIPYHKLGVAKYASLNRKYELSNIKPHLEDSLSGIVKEINQMGYHVVVNG